MAGGWCDLSFDISETKQHVIKNLTVTFYRANFFIDQKFKVTFYSAKKEISCHVHLSIKNIPETSKP